MNKCPSSGRLSYLGRRSFFLRPTSLPLITYGSLRKANPNWGIHPKWRQWSRQSSVSSAHFGDSPALPESLPLEYAPAELPNCPASGKDWKDPNAWIPHIEKFLPPSLREGSDKSEASVPGNAAAVNEDIHARSNELVTLLFQARTRENLDLLAHLGLRLNRWPAVYALLSLLLDSADALQRTSMIHRTPSNLDWGLNAGVSFDQLTSSNVPRVVLMKSDSRSPYALEGNLDAWTERLSADSLSHRFMGEVWQTLGSIILEAADLPSNDSKLAMSYVFRILARLHHSGSIADRVYKSSNPDYSQSVFRPPGIHLLSTHIMSVLSDAAWLVHEAEVAAKAAAAGEESPFLPFKMGVRELGPEIWLELVLWCCVEHGHVKEAVWLLEQMQARTGDLAWNLRSWRSLLEDPEVVMRTNIDTEEFWRHPDIDNPQVSKSRKGSFHGLAKRTISMEVVAALLDGLMNQVCLESGYHGLSPSDLLRYISRLRSIMASTVQKELQSTTKNSNWLTTRLIESGCVDPGSDPAVFERLLRAHTDFVPPWDVAVSTDENILSQFTKSQLYDETSALSGLIEYNIRSYAALRHCGGAFNAFAWLQEVVDSSKLQRVREFMQQVGRSNSPTFFDVRGFSSRNLQQSSIPQLSNVTFAELLDLVTTSRAFAFGEWLLFSNDLDGPPISPNAYGDQVLAPSILRFAIATRNTPLCNKVIESLSQPLSWNTLKAVLNFRIAMGEWDRVIAMFTYLRDYKLKSWGHVNIMALAAALLRMDRTLQRQRARGASVDDREAALAQAKDILLRLLNGEFDSPTHLPGTTFQQKALYSLHQMFMSLPGVLQDVAAKADLEYKAIPRHAFEIVPSVAFHLLLAAVVDVYGSAAGKQLWEQWCMEPLSPNSRRLGVPRLYSAEERNFAQGDPHFDPIWFARVQKKAVIPNLNTVRIIAQAAVKEYSVAQSQMQKADQGIHSLLADLPSPPGHTTRGDAVSVVDVLDFCVEQYKSLRLDDEEIDRETNGHLSRMKKRGLPPKPPKPRRRKPRSAA